MTKSTVTTADELRDELRDAASDRAAFCAEHGISPQYLCDILKGRRDISCRVARALGYERATVFRRIGGGEV